MQCACPDRVFGLPIPGASCRHTRRQREAAAKDATRCWPKPKNAVCACKLPGSTQPTVEAWIGCPSTMLGTRSLCTTTATARTNLGGMQQFPAFSSLRTTDGREADRSSHCGRPTGERVVRGISGRREDESHIKEFSSPRALEKWLQAWCDRFRWLAAGACPLHGANGGSVPQHL